MENERYAIKRKLHAITGDLNFALERFGDEIAKREKYKDLDGMEAIWFYLMKTYRWLPSQVRALNQEDIRFALSQEMHGWTLPKAAITATKKRADT